jgi:hypothetical protein
VTARGYGRIIFLHGGSIEDGDDNYDVIILTSMMTWRLLFPDGDIETKMVSPPWNNFLWSLLRFVVVRSATTKDQGE